MSEILTKSIEVLADGKIKAITTPNNEVVYLQPIIVVDSKEVNQRLEVKGSDDNQIRVSTDIKTIDGVAFSGSFSALETAIREAAKTANGLRVGGATGGGGTGDASAALQTVGNDKLEEIRSEQSTITAQQAQTVEIAQTNEYLILKNIGISFDLNSEPDFVLQGFPVTLNGAAALGLDFGILNNYSSTQLCDDIGELVNELNSIQADLTFEAVGTTVLAIKDRNLTASDLVNLMFSFTFEDLEYSPPYIVIFPSSNLDSINEAAKSINRAILELESSTPSLDSSISLSYTGTGVKNLTVDADLDGKTIAAGSFADVTVIAIDNDVEYRFDGGVAFPSKKYPRTKKDNASTLYKNVKVDDFRIKGIAGGSDYALIINIYK